jgi:hypothetical protein
MNIQVIILDMFDWSIIEDGSGDCIWVINGVGYGYGDGDGDGDGYGVECSGEGSAYGSRGWASVYGNSNVDGILSVLIDRGI